MGLLLPSIPGLSELQEIYNLFYEGFWPTVHTLNDFFRDQIGAKIVPIALASWILVFKITSWRYKKQREEYARKRGIKQ